MGRSILSYESNFTLIIHFLLDRAIESVYRAKGWSTKDVNNGEKPYPTLSELYKQLEKELETTNYDGEIKGNIRSALEMRIGSLLRREMADIFDVKKSTINPEDWLKKTIVIELEALGEGPANFTTLLLCTLIRETLKVCSKDKNVTVNGVRHVIFIEEAHNLIAPTAQVETGDNANPKIAATAFIVKMLAEVRALHEGIIIADQLPTAMAPEVIKNTNIKLVHRLTSGDDRGLIGGTMSANELQMENVATYSSGQALFIYEGMLRPFEMRVHYQAGHDQAAPTDEDLYEIMKSSPGYRDAMTEYIKNCLMVISTDMDEYRNKVYAMAVDISKCDYNINTLESDADRFIAYRKKVDETAYNLRKEIEKVCIDESFVDKAEKEELLRRIEAIREPFTEKFERFQKICIAQLKLLQ